MGFFLQVARQAPTLSPARVLAYACMHLHRPRFTRCLCRPIKGAHHGHAQGTRNCTTLRNFLAFSGDTKGVVLGHRRSGYPHPISTNAASRSFSSFCISPFTTLMSSFGPRKACGHRDCVSKPETQCAAYIVLANNVPRAVCLFALALFCPSLITYDLAVSSRML